MIHFCLAHTGYRLHCQLPRSQRLRLQATVLFLGVMTLLLQFYVLLRPRSALYCSQPLLINLVGNIVLSFFTFSKCVVVICQAPSKYYNLLHTARTPLRIVKGQFSSSLHNEACLKANKQRQVCISELLKVTKPMLFLFHLGLAVLLTQMEPVPRALKGMLGVLGVGSCGEGVCTVGFTVLASDCEKSTPELYYLSVLLSVGSLVSTVLYAGMGLIWLSGVRRRDAKPTI
ncbi:uncharacterized protein RHO17_010390 [Thomomys bottae]